MSSNSPHSTQAMPLFSYTIASADMRYIERAERQITLCRNLSDEAYIRGEIPDCGSDCYIDLGQISIEYAMSCEGCREAGELEGYIDHFGERIGKALSVKLKDDNATNDAVDLFLIVIECILRSTNITFEKHQEEKHFAFELGQCPITEAAKRYGINRGKELAHRALITLCIAAADAVMPGSKLVEPSERSSSNPLHRLVFTLP